MRSADEIRADLAAYTAAFNNTEWSREDWLLNVGEAAVGVCESVPVLLDENQALVAVNADLANRLNDVAADRDRIASAVEAFCEEWSAPTRRKMHAHEWADLTRAVLAAAAAPRPAGPGR